MKKYSFTYEVRRTEIVHATIIIEVSEDDLLKKTHRELEDVAIEQMKENGAACTKHDRYFRADLMSREEIK